MNRFSLKTLLTLLALLGLASGIAVAVFLSSDRVFVPISEAWADSHRQTSDRPTARIPVADLQSMASPARPYRVAHAGGAIGGITYSNAREALELALSRGCSYLEVDFDWTGDDRLVLIHDWGPAAGRTFGPSFAGRQMTLAEFTQTPRIDGLTQLAETDLLEWLRENPRAFVVTDIKWKNVQGLQHLAELASPDLLTRLIPQIYGFEELEPTLALGYKKVILTLYRSEYSDDEVVAFDRLGDLWAVTMPTMRALKGLANRLREAGVETYAHTVNSPAVATRLLRRGATGIYTDDLCGSQWPSADLPLRGSN